MKCSLNVGAMSVDTTTLNSVIRKWSVHKTLDRPVEINETTNVEADVPNSCWKSTKSCDFSEKNTHDRIASLAGIATVISGIVAVLIIFVGGGGSQKFSTDQSSNITALESSAPINPIFNECPCINGIGTLNCFDSMRYHREKIWVNGKYQQKKIGTL